MPLPTLHTAGDAFSATLSDADRPATAGWAAQLVLVGTGRITINSAASGDAHAFDADSAATAAWLAGAYQVRVLYTLAGARTTVEAGWMQILPDPAAVGTDARALMSPWTKILADLEAAYQAHITSGRAIVGAYTINGRSMQFQTAADLIRAMHNARTEIAREEAAARLARGESPRVRYHTRM